MLRLMIRKGGRNEGWRMVDDEGGGGHAARAGGTVGGLVRRFREFRKGRTP